MFSQISRAIIFVLMIEVPTFAQGTVDKDGVFRPTEEEIANNKRIIELWRHPTFVTLRLASTRREIPDEEPTTTPAPYANDQRMYFQLFITQSSGEDLMIAKRGGPFFEYRPELIRDGDAFPYSREAQEEVARAEREVAPRYGSVSTTKLISGREALLGLVDLETW